MVKWRTQFTNRPEMSYATATRVSAPFHSFKQYTPFLWSNERALATKGQSALAYVSSRLATVAHEGLYDPKIMTWWAIRSVTVSKFVLRPAWFNLWDKHVTTKVGSSQSTRWLRWPTAANGSLEPSPRSPTTHRIRNSSPMPLARRSPRSVSRTFCHRPDDPCHRIQQTHSMAQNFVVPSQHSLRGQNPQDYPVRNEHAPVRTT